MNPGTEIVIRAQEARDIEAINEIFNCPGVIAGTLQLPHVSVDWRREHWQSHAPGRHSLVAEMVGRVVGVLGLHVEGSPRRRHCAGLGMGVHDHFQGRGVGGALITAAMDLADNWLGLERIELTVFVDNAPAIHLYQKAGFEIEGTARAYAFRGGRYEDVYSMARLRLRG